ncbi:MAG: hypothetical protein ABEJ44_06175 [Halanaeroarchaeum sp.]
MKRVVMQNGDIVDPGTDICNHCGQPGADVEGGDGEYYHNECLESWVP